MSLSKGTCLSGKTYWSSLSAITITMETKKDVTATSATKSVNSETESGSVASASVEREQFGDTKQHKYTIMIDLRQVHRVGEHHMVMISEKSEKSDGSGHDTVGKSGAKDGRMTRNAQQEVKAGKDAVKKLIVCNHGNSMVKEKSAELVMTRNTTCEHHCNKSLMKQVKGQVTQTKPTVGVKGQGVLKVSHLAKQGQVSLEGQGQKVGSEQEQGKNPARTKPSLPSNGNGEEESRWSILREVLAEANVKLNSEVPEYDLWLPRKQQKCLRKLKDLLKPVSMESFELVQLLIRGDGEEASDEKGCKTENDNRRKMLSDNKRKSVSDNSLITGSQWDQFMFSLFLEDYGYHVTRSTDRASCMENVVKEMLNDEIFLSEVMSRLVSASDIVNAEKFFGTLAHMTTSQLPQARLLALLGDKKKQLLTDERNRKSETKLTDRTTESVGRAGLVYTSTDALQQKAQDLCHRQKFVQHYVKQLTYDAVQCNQKQTMLHGIWPEILSDMVHSAVLDMWDTNSYMKRCLEEVERS